MAHPNPRDAYRQTMNSMHKNNMPQSGLMSMPGNAGSPPSDPNFNVNPGAPGGGPQFNPNRMVQQNKPALTGMSMMPPPSPAINGPQKDQHQQQQQPGKDGNKNVSNPANGHPESPRNHPPGSGQTPTAPPTPVPLLQQNQGHPQQQNPHTPQQNNMAPSPGSMMGGPPPLMNTGPPPPPIGGNGSGGLTGIGIGNPMGTGEQLFDAELMHSMAISLGEFDHQMFRPDGDINFERDFGQWFSPDDTPGLDPSMK